MKNLKKRKMASIIIFMVLAVVCFVLYFSLGQIRYLFSAILAMLGSVIGYYSIHDNYLLKLYESVHDERDVLISLKSGYLAVKIINWVLFIVTITGFYLYSILKFNWLFVASITLASIILLLFLVLFITNIFYEYNS